MSNPGKTNLISWWSLDETSGTRNDSHGTNHLTDNNTVLYAAGKVGNAADFEADNNEYLSRADNADLSGGGVSGDFTFACWVYLESLGGVPVDTARTFASKWDAGVAAEWGIYQFNNSGTQELRMVASGNGSTLSVIASAGLAMATGGWHYVVGWHDGTADKIYLQVDNGTPAEAAHSTGIYNSDKPFVIGGLYVTGSVDSNYAMDGLIDEASFWKRVLTADERTWLYNSGNGRTYSELLAGQVSVGGTLTTAGTVVKRTNKTLAGVLSSAGVVAKRAGKVLAGAVTSAGVVVKRTGKPLTGALSTAGAITRRTGKTLAGALTSTGSLSGGIAIIVGGLVDLTARARAFALSVRDRNS